MLEVKNLSKAFGGLQVVRNLSLRIAAGERLVILGPNGAGKTTLFNLLVGELKPDKGDIFLDGQSIGQLSVIERARIGISRSYQQNNLFEQLTIEDNLKLAVATTQGKSRQLGFDSFRDRKVIEMAEYIAKQVNLSDHLNMPVAAVSYGYRRQLEIGIALATQPKILMMDEPTSGVEPAMIYKFHQLLASLSKQLAVVIIEHDMDLAFEIADRILVLNFGEIVFEGTPQATRGNSLVREIYLGDWQANAQA